MKDITTKEEIDELKYDFQLLVENYWYVSQCYTGKCTPFPQDEKNNTEYCKGLISKYRLV